MSWNYRVVRHKNAWGHEYFGLHEVYYDKHDKIDMWCDRPEHSGATMDDLIRSLRLQLQAAEQAHGRGILDATDMPSES